jgi:hypothetical protein
LRQEDGAGIVRNCQGALVTGSNAAINPPTQRRDASTGTYSRWSDHARDLLNVEDLKTRKHQGTVNLLLFHLCSRGCDPWACAQEAF